MINLNNIMLPNTVQKAKLPQYIIAIIVFQVAAIGLYTAPILPNLWKNFLEFFVMMWCGLCILLFTNTHAHSHHSTTTLWKILVATLCFSVLNWINQSLNQSFFWSSFLDANMLYSSILIIPTALLIAYSTQPTTHAESDILLIENCMSLVSQLGRFIGIMLLIWLSLALGFILLETVGLHPWSFLFNDSLMSYSIIGLLSSVALLNSTSSRIRINHKPLLTFFLYLFTLFGAIYLLEYPFYKNDNSWIFDYGSSVRLCIAALLWILILFTLDFKVFNSVKVAWIASIVGSILILISCWGISVRIHQYGLSYRRIWMAWLVTYSIICYAGLWLKLIRPQWQIWKKLVLILFVIFSISLYLPWLHPMRLAFNSQLARLTSQTEHANIDTIPPKQSKEILFQFGKQGQESQKLFHQLDQKILSLQQKQQQEQEQGKWQHYWQTAVICDANNPIWLSLQAAWEKYNITAPDDSSNHPIKDIFKLLDLNHDHIPELITLHYTGKEANNLQLGIYAISNNTISTIKIDNIKAPLTSYEKAAQCLIHSTPAQYDDIMIDHQILQKLPN